ncbi:hypothetical protein [Humibacter ginsenosidimutans]|uniref:Uncharacterized protein n=1 Tax=Humibacter ginsenosidimutans TaxID=2599293 RepID=A0A5B8M5W1_9MICO|nr:hypothetical protein [Humibacter ginsenosidimutans]QDZ15763.1 hypothetical protein FPZ11_14235 [Humibacter ginsenosidimutans]
MSNRQRLGIAILALGVIVAIAGVIVGFVPVTKIGESCGTAFSPSGPDGFSLSAAYVDTLCKQQVAPFIATTWTLIIAGLVAIVAGIALILVQRAPAIAHA